MHTPARHSSASKAMPRLGAGLTGLVVLFLAFDGITKVIRVAPVVEACQKAGIASDLVTGIGLLLLVCTVIYIIPKTAILGAILLTGYLGGAVTGSRDRAGRKFPNLLCDRLWRAGLDRTGSARTSVGPVNSLAAVLAGPRNNQKGEGSRGGGFDRAARAMSHSPDLPHH